MNRGYLLGWLSVLGMGCLQTSQARAEGFALAQKGKAAAPLVISSQASDATEKLARRLAEYLHLITGGDFEIKKGDAAQGIVLGKPTDFPNVKVDSSLTTGAMTDRENYLLRSNSKALLMLGATDLAVQHAVWDLLYRAGYRQYFPGKTWEVIPVTPNLMIDVDSLEKPNFYARRIWYGYGPWDYASQAYEDWCEKNRVSAGVDLSTGHSYDGILHRHKAEFDAHPEYLALVNGQRRPPKFCISNEGLRKLVIDDALAQFAENPSRDSVSLDPSDGGGWCECEACAKLGSVSDRALFLANEVARAVNAKYPGKLVGMYAYNYHSPPPHIRVDPHVIVSAAAGFIKGGLTLDEIIDGWAAQGATLGIREYYSVNPWDRDQPAQARAGNLAYLKKTIPEFYAKGARFFSAESSDNWGPNGLGYYLASRMLWNVKEAGSVDAEVNEFLTRAFPGVEEPMREFYQELDGSRTHLVPQNQLAKMFRALERARKGAMFPEVQERLHDLALYCHYVDLFHQYSDAKGAERQKAFEALLRHAYRMRKTMLVHSKALYRDLPARDHSVKLPPEASFNAPEGKNPWKSSEPYSDSDVDAFIMAGLESYPPVTMPFEPVSYSTDLVSSAPLHLESPIQGHLGAGRGKQAFYTEVSHAPSEIKLRISGGLIAGYRDRGNVRLDLWKIGGASATGERETLIVEDRSVPPDGASHEVTLAVKEAGLYKLAVDDGQDRTQVECLSDLPWTVRASLDEPLSHFYSEPWDLCFYVPKETKVVGLFGSEYGEVCDPTGKKALSLVNQKKGYYSITVPEGQDGQVWTLQHCRGSVILLTTPPYLATTPKALLLPAEVVRKDSPP